MAINAGSQAYGVDLPPTQYDQDWTTQSPTTTTYTAGQPEVGVNFVAPSSGRVLVTLGAGTRTTTAVTTRAVVTFIVYNDNSDGPVVQAAAFNNGITGIGTASVSQYRYVGTFKMISGLTPGRNYYAQMVHRSTAAVAAGVVSIAARDISVIPLT